MLTQFFFHCVSGWVFDSCVRFRVKWVWFHNAKLFCQVQVGFELILSRIFMFQSGTTKLMQDYKLGHRKLIRVLHRNSRKDITSMFFRHVHAYPLLALSSNTDQQSNMYTGDRKVSKYFVIKL